MPTLLRSRTTFLLFGAAACLSFAITGCATVPTLPVQAASYNIDVRLNPARHTIDATTRITLVNAAKQPITQDHPLAVELYLHPDIKLTDVRLTRPHTESSSPADAPRGGARLAHRIKRAGGWARRGKSGGFHPRVHRIILEDPAAAFGEDGQRCDITLTYHGKLFQDVAAGEKPGAIHNFEMRAHVGDDGVYLAGGYWYPQPVLDDYADGCDVPLLADYELTVAPVPGFEFVASGVRDVMSAEQTGRLGWDSPYPLDGMVLVGGRHDVYRAVHGGVVTSLHLKPSQAELAEGLLATLGRYLDRYQPLIGRYPAPEFAIVNNFFSSGFAFPTFTLLGSAVIDMGERSQTAHGYIDHEVLHSWWGNGIHVDPRDGNWCEALASYGANYYGYILDGNEEDARRKRRNDSHFLSRMKPKNDKPLGTYGHEEGCNRSIAYNKGAVVFHMLARKIGQETFWSAMRRLTAEYVGRYASWDDIRRLCEEESGQSLELFFRQWVRSGGAPKLTIESARYDSSSQTLTVKLTQGEPAFDLDVPLRLTYAGSSTDITVPLWAPSDEVSIPLEQVPESVEVDPDYHIFRKVSRTDMIPTTNTTRAGKMLLTVWPPEPVLGEYAALREVFETSFDDDEHAVVTADEVSAEQLANASVLILGDAIGNPVVASFLARADLAIAPTEDGFTFQGTAYTSPIQCVLATVHHPTLPKAGVTVFFGNSAEALPSARVIPFYDRSVVIFEDGKPILRQDFEVRHAVRVER